MISPENKKLLSTTRDFFQKSKDIYILHVDDEAEIRTTFSEMIAEAGIRVLSASGSDEGIKLLNEYQNKIVLIVSDVKMPEKDGFTFRAEALKIAPSVPFCVVSAYVDREMALRGIELKIVAFLPKPFKFDQILEIINKEAVPKLNSILEDRELKQGFVSDTESLIEESEEILLKLEQNTNDLESLNRFFAIMHTIKGASAFFEPKDLHKFSHAYEEILKKLQKNELAFNTSVMELLFKGFDVIKDLHSEFKNEKHLSKNLDDLLKIINTDSIKFDSDKEKVISKGFIAGTEEVTKDQTPQVNKNKTQEDIKVSIKLLDEFMQLSGEVTVIRNMLNKCVSSIERRFAGDRDVGMLTELLSELHKINTGVQNKMSEIRKVSLKSVVKVLPRAVRDVTKSLGKKVELQVSGDELRVDTSIADVLNNSLLHIIKNSIDHGIESAEQRLAEGKSEIGNITVDFSISDEKVYVKISDDGKGLNKDAIKAKLLKSGTHTQEQINQMTNTELYSMIFSSGFSTAQQVTEISGRGVGMSMVKDCVEAIGGQILIKSEDKKGATFSLVLPEPKSVLIASCLGVKFGNKRFSVIQDDIVKVLQFDSSNYSKHIKVMEKTEFLIFDSNLIPIISLKSLLYLNETEAPTNEQRKLIVLNNRQDNRKIAIEVSEILEVEDMVIKSIHHSINSNSFYRGVTFLDDGGVGLILNTSGIMDAIGVLASRKLDSTKLDVIEKFSQISNSETTRMAVTIDLGYGNTYALPQELVFRIEEFNEDELTQSGSELVMPYRGQILKLINLYDKINSEQSSGSNMIHENDTSTNPTNQINRKSQMIVIKNENKYIGLRVEKVLDIVGILDLKTDLAQPNKLIQGHFFSEDNTISLIDVSSLLNKNKGVTIDLGNKENIDNKVTSENLTEDKEISESPKAA